MGRQKGVNPDRLRATSALEEDPPPEVFRRRVELRRLLSVALLNLLSVVLLTVSFAPFHCWYLAYVALVPWVLALGGARPERWGPLLAWAAGLVFWAGNLYWMWWIDLVGYSALAIYLSFYWLAAALVVRAALRRNLPTWLVLPVVWVALEYARSYGLSGFPWLFLAQSQYRQVRLIQIADLTGEYGVSFWVAMVNGVVVDLLSAPLFARGRKGERLSRRLLLGLGVVLVVLAGLLGYGTWRLGQNTQREGYVLGLVQRTFRISLRGADETRERIFESHLQASQAFAGAGCELVLWPETMLPGPLNGELLEANLEGMGRGELVSLAGKIFGLDWARAQNASDLRRELGGVIREGFEKYPDVKPLRFQADQVGELSRRLGCPILAGGATLHPNPRPTDAFDLWEERNSALWFDGSGKAQAVYSKVHLVPFGEYVPFKHSWPALYRVLRRFVPEVMPQLAPGSEFMRFTLQRGSREPWRLASPICYEGTFDRVCRRMVMDGRAKAVHVLANLSNDGWFVWQWGSGRPHGSTEHPQHLAQYCFRAIENRVPVVRAVNTGVSASIDSNGRIVAAIGFDRRHHLVAGTLLLDGKCSGEREYEAGHGPKVLVDSRVSPYSRVGNLFAILVSLAGAALACGLVAAGRGRMGTVQKEKR